MGLVSSRARPGGFKQPFMVCGSETEVTVRKSVCIQAVEDRPGPGMEPSRPCHSRSSPSVSSREVLIPAAPAASAHLSSPLSPTLAVSGAERFQFSFVIEPECFPFPFLPALLTLGK